MRRNAPRDERREDAMACPYHQRCNLDALFTSRSAMLLWRREYCESDHQECARLRLEESGLPVPEGLLPNGFVLEPLGHQEAV
jgi:hypothetical protein